MRIFDNTPIFEPAIGTLAIETSHESCQFKANHFYYVSNNNTSEKLFVDISYINDVRNINTYTIAEEQCPNILHLKNLQNAIIDEDANIILALLTPCRDEYYFLVSKSDKNDMLRTITLMAYSAERITRQCMIDAIKNYAINDTDDFLNTTRNLFSSKKFVKEYLSDVASTTLNPKFGMAPSRSDLMETLNLKKYITHRERLRMLDEMEKILKNNISKYRKNARTEEEREERRKADAEIDLLCSNIDPETIKRLFNIMSPSQRDRALKLLDPREVAKNSSMSLSVERSNVNYVNERTTDGYYCLFFKKDGRRMQVHFGRRASSVLYLIYLIDRYRKPEVDTLNLKNYQEQYVNIYNMLYHSKSEGEAKFKELWQKYDKRPQIHLCLNDIRQTIYSACKEMDEIASPYMLETEFSHLFVDSSKIYIPHELVELMT